MRYELSDYEWTAIKPMLPNKPRGVRRVNDRRVLNGIFWVLRSGAPVARPARNIWSPLCVPSLNSLRNRRWRCPSLDHDTKANALTASCVRRDAQMAVQDVLAR